MGGHNKIKMAELKECYESLGLKNVITYIQSGNVIFDLSSGTAESIRSKLEKEIKKTFGFEVTVVLRTPAELKKIIEKAPYSASMMKDTKLLYVTLFPEKADPSKLEQVDTSKYLPDQYFLQDKELYLYLPNGAGRTKLNNTFFENKLKTPGTARNWNTLNELVRLTE